ncbi:MULTISPECIES: carbohydrate ABC transporter permease [unclassified Kitasatospora]|uniref:carbohydrate ABC transporter permease n=1 Tax=unclassified Kitasatospora TaxID=2633591 RepID=UPI0034193BC0
MSTADLRRRPETAGPARRRPAGPARLGAPGRRPRPNVLGTAVLFVLSAYFLLPAWWLLVASTKSSSDLFGSGGFWFSTLHLGDNLHDLATANGGLYFRWLLNTVLYAGVGAAAATLLAAMAGYALTKYRFRGREAVFNTILAAVLVPAPLLALPVYLLLSKAHLVNTVWAVLLPSMVSPFGVYLSRIYAAASVPDEILEAARMDGAGEFRIFFTVVLRIFSPALVTIFLFQFTTIWNNFFLPLVTLSDQKLWPVNLGLYYWNGLRDHTPYNLVVTGSLVSVVPLVVAFLLLQRFWRTDLTAGGVKA